MAVSIFRLSRSIPIPWLNGIKAKVLGVVKLRCRNIIARLIASTSSAVSLNRDAGCFRTIRSNDSLVSHATDVSRMAIHDVSCGRPSKTAYSPTISPACTSSAGSSLDKACTKTPRQPVKTMKIPFGGSLARKRNCPPKMLNHTNSPSIDDLASESSRSKALGVGNGICQDIGSSVIRTCQSHLWWGSERGTGRALRSEHSCDRSRAFSKFSRARRAALQAGTR